MSWAPIARDSNYVISFDTLRIWKRQRQTYAVWYRTDHAVPHLYQRERFDREIVQGLLRCSDMSFKVVSVDLSLGDGDPISEQRATPSSLRDQPWRPIERGTLDERAALLTCEFARQRLANRR